MTRGKNPRLPPADLLSRQRGGFSKSYAALTTNDRLASISLKNPVFGVARYRSTASISEVKLGLIRLT